MELEIDIIFYLFTFLTEYVSSDLLGDSDDKRGLIELTEIAIMIMMPKHTERIII